MADFKKRRRWTGRAAWLVAAALAVGGWWWWSRSSGPDDAASPAGLGPGSDRYHKALKGDFEILVLVDGSVDAIKRHELRTESRRHFPLTLINCVEDNTRVKAGDVVMECQADKFVERIEDIEKNLEDNAKDLDLKRDLLVIRRSTNLSSLKAAVDKLRNAEDALEKYCDIDARKSRTTQQENIEKAEAAQVSAEAALAEAEKKRSELQDDDANAIAKADTEVASKKTAVETAKAAVATALQDQRVWRQYEYPQKLRSLEQAVDQAGIDLKSQTMTANSNIFQLERDITNLERYRRRLKEDLKNFREDLAGLVIRAPIDGIVNLGNVNRPHWQQPKEWKVGTEINTREIVASIPDLSKFMIRCQIPEEHRSRVTLGLPARFRSSAVPDLMMEGKLGLIEPVAVNLSPRDQSSPKVYNAQIFTDTNDERLMPGMSVKVEIVVERVQDVLYVPIEAVYNNQGQTFVRVRSAFGQAEERAVEAGRSSLSHVEILDGLREGEEVLLINAAFETA